jgi:hypothetical protein
MTRRLLALALSFALATAAASASSIFTPETVFPKVGGSAGPYVLVNHTFKQCTGLFCSSVTTNAIDTRGADLIIVITEGGASGGALSDSKSNIWTPLTGQNTGPTLRILYAKNAIVDASHTFTSNPSGGASLAVLAFSGSNLTAPFDVENGAQTSSGTTLQTGSVAPALDGELLVFAVGDSWTGTASVDTGAILDQGAWQSNVHDALASAYEIQTTKATRNPTFTTTADRRAAVIAAFK